MNRITQYCPDIFDGSDLDPSLPLQFNQARHYDPTPGVWINEEPVGYAGDNANVRPYRVSPAQDNPISDDRDQPTGR